MLSHKSILFDPAGPAGHTTTLATEVREARRDRRIATADRSAAVAFQPPRRGAGDEDRRWCRDEVRVVSRGQPKLHKFQS